MKVENTTLEGVLILTPEEYQDNRGLFKELFNSSELQNAGISEGFVQDNFSRSKRHVLRGLHYQKTKPQGKLVTCLRGQVFDVVADVNPKSVTFGKYLGVELSEQNGLQIWIPPGYAHGFCVLSDEADFFYKCSDFYNPSDEAGIIWNDPTLSIVWPTKTPLLSVKDQQFGKLPETA